MTLLFIVLCVIVVAALVLAVELLRPEPVSDQNLASVGQALSEGRNYEPMLRLFDPQDFRTIASIPAGEKRLTQERRRVMRAYLKELREDFLRAWAVCRLLAPISESADPVLTLFRHWLDFHTLFGAVLLRTYFGQTAGAAQQARMLVTAFGEMRSGAAQLLELDAEVDTAAAGA